MEYRLQYTVLQISLAERPKSKEQLIIRKKIARSLRPCNLRRPWSATPSLGYRVSLLTGNVVLCTELILSSLSYFLRLKQSLP